MGMEYLINSVQVLDKEGIILDGESWGSQIPSHIHYKHTATSTGKAGGESLKTIQLHSLLMLWSLIYRIAEASSRM